MADNDTERSIQRMETVAERIEKAVDLMAKVFQHHETFLMEWLDRFKEICETSDEVQVVESQDESRLEEGRQGSDSGSGNQG